MKINYYEAGMDLGLSDDVNDSYERFQGRLKREYDRISVSDRMTVIDSSRSVEKIQAELRAAVLPILAGFPTMETLMHDD